MIKIATVCSGIGSPEQALKELGVEHEISFACEIDKYARQTYEANFKPNIMFTDMTQQSWVKSDIFSKEDKLYSDLFIGGIPCQSFSLAGKRLGELDPRGLLFFDFYRYVKNQSPKVFIIENVKGLLSDNNGKTFQNWVQLLGQSMNTHYNMFNHEDSLMYNLHFKVLNSKNYGVPQNRERVFLIGIRNDLPNSFRFPTSEPLKLRLKDILETDVNEKYYLSDSLIKCFERHTERHKAKGNGFSFEPTYGNKIANCVSTKSGQRPDDDFIMVSKEVRTEEAKLQRRKTGTNNFRSKEIIFEPSEIVNTIQTGLTNDNLILVQHIYQNKAEGGRVYSDHGISTTVKSTGGGLGGKSGLYKNDQSKIRRLTPLECMRLQGYPDNYIKPCSDTQTYKQAGNSITVKVMKALILNILPIIQ